MAKQKKGVKKVGLTDEDKTLINRQMRAGIIVSFLVLIIGFGLIFISFFMDKFELKYIWIPLVGTAIIANIVFMLMNRKYLGDLKDGSKYIETKKIQRKEIKKSHQAGSGTLYIGEKGIPVKIPYIIVENTRHEVTPEEFENSNEGEEVLFHYAANSNFLIKIEVKK